MRAITISRFGPPDVLTEVELPDPRPAAGQVAIDVTHAAVGMIDVFFRRGDRSGDPRFPTPPFVPGIEVAGTIRELGEGVTDFRVGEPVVTLSLMTLGGYATVALADARLTVSLTSSNIDPSQCSPTLPQLTLHSPKLHTCEKAKPYSFTVPPGAWPRRSPPSHAHLVPRGYSARLGHHPKQMSHARLGTTKCSPMTSFPTPSSVKSSTLSLTR